MPISIIHPSSDSAWAFVGSETTASFGFRSRFLIETLRFDSIPGLKPACYQKSFTAIKALGVVVPQARATGIITANASLPYQCSDSGNGGPSNLSAPRVTGQSPAVSEMAGPEQSQINSTRDATCVGSIMMSPDYQFACNASATTTLCGGSRMTATSHERTPIAILAQCLFSGVNRIFSGQLPLA
jgi:hypothetical protein